MTTELAFDVVLAVLLIGTAWFAVAARGLFAAIMVFVAYGILIALAWVRLDAVDVALAEAAIGAGLTGVLLVGAMARLERIGHVRDPDAPSRLTRAFAGALCLGVSALLMAAVIGFDRVSAGLAPLVFANLAETGVHNPVTAVLLNLRAYDTLLESIVLLVALVAVWSLTPDSLWGGRPGLRQRVRQDGVLATFGRLLPPIGLMVGVYLVWVGSKAPGGAFQGGTVLAAVLLVAYMGGIVDPPRMTETSLRAAAAAGPAFFLLVGIVGAFAGVFLAMPVAWASELILLIELALAASVAVILALVIVGIPRRPP